MNSSNAITFAIVGCLMEVLPHAFPSLFPPTGGSEASCRALWLTVMGAVQVSLGLGYLSMVHVSPVAGRLVARVPARGAGTLPLPSSQSLTVR
jgi:hypothetical protein